MACADVYLQRDVPIYRLAGSAVPYTSNSGIMSKQLLIASNEDQWHHVWTELHSNRKPVTHVPKVEFDNTMVVVFAIGARRSGGYSVEITGAVQSVENLKLIAELRHPAPTCIVTSAITAPADVVLLPLTALPVVVEEVLIDVDC